jgi:putative hemolysin
METEKTLVISPEQLRGSLGLKGKFGLWVAKRVIRLLDIDRVNDIQSRYPDLKGPAFSEKVLEEVGVKYEIPSQDLANIPAEGGFITISNHHFGSIDGLILNSVVGSRRPDYKLLTTFLLALIPSLKEAFLPVDNLSGGKADARSINGIRMALRHIADGGCIGFFPAGEVGTWQKKKNRREGGFFTIQDKPWADNITKLIKRSGLPVIPIYFEGTNSLTFHRLGLIHPRLRTVRLIHELFNKQGTTVKVRIGRPILPEEMEGREITELSWYLRGRCYALKNAEE